jgi:hypothetical protein
VYSFYEVNTRNLDLILVGVATGRGGTVRSTLVLLILFNVSVFIFIQMGEYIRFGE